MKNQFIAIAALVFIANSPVQGNAVIKIPNIAGKTHDQVLKILGKPIKSETAKPSNSPCPCPKNTYNNGAINIIFINGRADWISLREFGNAPYSKDSLELIGLPVIDPTFSNALVMRWKNIPNFNEVSIFSKSNGEDVDLIYIKSKTK